MKKHIITLAVLVCMCLTSKAQNTPTQLDEALIAYKAGKLQDARFALQEALDELDRVIGAEILQLFPPQLGSLNAEKGSDQVTGGSSGIGRMGFFVSRNYKSDSHNTASLQIIGDSPALTGINALLALPVFAPDPNQKRIRVGNYRGILRRSQTEEGLSSWECQIPFGNSLLTLQCSGSMDEKAVTDMAAMIPMDKIAAWLQ